MIRRSLVVAVALASSAALAAPASGVAAASGDATGTAATGAVPSLADGTSNVTQADSVYPGYGDPRIDALSYDLSLKWEPSSSTLDGTETLQLRATQTTTEFRLGLASGLDVASVQVDGAPVTATRDGDNLVIPAAMTADSTHTVVITYSGTPQTVPAPTSRVDMASGLGWHTTSTGQVWTVQQPYGAFTWYPVNDMPADKATYSVKLDVPSNLVGISNGKMESRATVGDRQVTTFSNDEPMSPDRTTVAIGAFSKYTQTGPHGLPMTYWYPTGHSEMLTPLKSLPSELTWLETRLGTYPFSTLGVVVVPSDIPQDTQTMISLGSGNYRYGNRDVREQLLHQLVHAWYGDAVTPSDWRDAWMSEGMAEYLEARYSTAQGWKSAGFWNGEFNRNDPYWREIYGPPGAYDHQEFDQINLAYCTARMLGRLRTRIGGSAFVSAMKAWPKNPDVRYGTTDRNAYVNWLQTRTGKPLAAFFATELDDPKPKM